MKKINEEIKKKENLSYDSSSIDSKEKQKQIDSNSLNQLLSVIYDDEFVIMINDLSHAIKIYNKSMIKFINQMTLIISKNKSILESLKEEKYSELRNLPSIFNSIETDYKTFFSTAKIIFKKMKKYRNERLENINKLPIGDKNLKFCFINMNKNYGTEGILRHSGGGNQKKLIEKKDNMSIYSKTSSNKDNSLDKINYNLSGKSKNLNNINFESIKLYEENIELKKKIFNLEKKIDIIGNNKKSIITNNINNISNYHLQEFKNQNEIIKIIKNLINILEYEKSPDYSFNKNTFDNVEEIAEHKKEITNQKDELIFIIKNFLNEIKYKI